MITQERNEAVHILVELGSFDAASGEVISQIFVR